MINPQATTTSYMKFYDYMPLVVVLEKVSKQLRHATRGEAIKSTH